MSDDNYFQEELDENIDDDEGFDGDEQIESVPTHSFGLRSGRAAEASSSNTNGSFDYSSGREDSPTGLIGPLRKGKWTNEEEKYANKIISYFNKGLLGIACGTTLRSYLSEKLNCDPMRITKKFAGASCIGKQVYQPAEHESNTTFKATVTKIEGELKELEQAFLKRLFSKSGGHSGSFNSLEDFGGSTTRSRGSSVSNSGGGLRSLSDRNTSSVKPKQLGLDMLGYGGSKPKRVTSAPDLTQLSVIYHKKSTYSSLMKRQRSISLMDLEHYAVDDDAAGDLLMQFMEKISESAVKKPKLLHQQQIIKEEISDDTVDTRNQQQENPSKLSFE